MNESPRKLKIEMELFPLKIREIKNTRDEIELMWDYAENMKKSVVIIGITDNNKYKLIAVMPGYRNIYTIKRINYPYKFVDYFVGINNVEGI